MKGLNCPRVFVAALVTAAALGWWAFVIHGVRGGNWSALYMTGSPALIPEALKAEHVYQFPAGLGFDGQFYHFIAHDPWLVRGFQPAVDAPRMRWRRILMSALAWSLAGGRDAWVDPAFYAVVLASIFLGVWWSAGFLEARGAPAWWGAAFLAAPAALISLDRVVVDLALSALAAGVLYSIETNRYRTLWFLLAASVLVRETGLLLVAGWVAWLIMERQVRRAACFAAATLPAIAWWLYVAGRTQPERMPGWGGWLPMAQPIQAFLRPTAYPFSTATTRVVVAFDYIALAGTLLAILLGLAAAWRHGGALRYLLPVFGLFGFVLTATASLEVFQDVFSHARLLSPLILLLAADGAARREWVGAVPLALTAPRIGMLVAAQGLAVLRGWLG